MKTLCLCLVIALVSPGSSKPLSDAPDGAQDNNNPDLSGMLDALKGGVNLRSTLRFVREFRLFVNVYKELSRISPVAKNLMTNLAQKNAQIRVLMKIANGQFPDLKDIYDLTTTQNADIATAIATVMSKDQNLQQIFSLLRKKNFAKSEDDIKQSIRMFTGKNIDFPSSIMREISNGKYTVVSAHDLKYRNLIELVLTGQSNLKIIMSTVSLLTNAPIDYLAILRNFVAMDKSRLAQILAPQGPDKNTASGHVQTDPDAAKIIEELNSCVSTIRSNDQTRARAVAMDLIMKLFGLSEKVIEAVDGDPNKTGKDAKSDRAVFG